MFVNILADEALLEEVPNGDHSLCIDLDEEALAVLRALAALGNFDVSRALGQLYLAGLRAGQTTGVAGR